MIDVDIENVDIIAGLDHRWKLSKLSFENIHDINKLIEILEKTVYSNVKENVK